MNNEKLPRSVWKNLQAKLDWALVALKKVFISLSLVMTFLQMPQWLELWAKFLGNYTHLEKHFWSLNS